MLYLAPIRQHLPLLRLSRYLRKTPSLLLVTEWDGS